MADPFLTAPAAWPSVVSLINKYASDTPALRELIGSKMVASDDETKSLQSALEFVKSLPFTTRADLAAALARQSAIFPPCATVLAELAIPETQPTTAATVMDSAWSAGVPEIRWNIEIGAASSVSVGPSEPVVNLLITPPGQPARAQALQMTPQEFHKFMTMLREAKSALDRV